MELKYELYDLILSIDKISNETAIKFLKEAMKVSTPFELIRLIDKININGYRSNNLTYIRIKAVRLYNERR